MNQTGTVGLSVAALSPMVDLLTLLLVAVLRTWSTDPPVRVPEAGFYLPTTSHEAPVGEGVVIDIGTSGLYVEGWRVGSASWAASTEDVLLGPVHDALQALTGQHVLVRAHAEAPWSVVGKVLFTAQQAGFDKVELVATSRASL